MGSGEGGGITPEGAKENSEAPGGDGFAKCSCGKECLQSELSRTHKYPGLWIDGLSISAKVVMVNDGCLELMDSMCEICFVDYIMDKYKYF